MDAKRWFRIRGLIDVAWGPIMETGASVPGYRAASPPALRFRTRIFCSRRSLTPVAAPNASPNVFWAEGRMRRSGFAATTSYLSTSSNKIKRLPAAAPAPSGQAQ